MEFGWSRGAVSISFAIAALSVGACSPFIGWLLDRYPARRIILPCLIVFGAGFASLSLLTGKLWQLYLVALVIGIVGNGAAHLAYSRVVTTWFEAKRGLAFAILLAGSAVGAIVLPPITEALTQSLGWRGAFAVLGGAVLAIGLPCAVRVRERFGGAQQSTGATAEGSTVRESVRSRVFWLILVTLFLISISQNGAIAHLAPLLTDHGVSAQQAAWAVSSMGASILLGRVLTGWFLDRYFAPRVAVILFALSALGSFLLSNTGSFATGITAASLIGFGMGGEGDITPYLLTRYFGLRSFSTLYGFSWTAYAIAGGAGPVIMGRAFDLTGSYHSLLIVLTAATLVAAALFLLMPRYAQPASLATKEEDLYATH